MAKQEVKSGSYKVRVGASVYGQALGPALYGGPGACLAEVVRNGAVACMAEKGKWDPNAVKLEVWHELAHPLSPNNRPALLVFDQGPHSGFTDERIERFCFWGQNELVTEGTLSGAAKHGLGRAAARGCMSKASQQTWDRPFYVFTRTGATGEVKKLTVSPNLLKDGYIPWEMIDSNSAELGRYRGIRGPFSVVVIPDTLFKNSDDLMRALEWRMPRKTDLSFRSVSIHGIRFEPPKLAKHSVSFSCGEVFIERTPKDDPESGGIWIADSVTGYRCALCTRLVGYLPWILTSGLLRGDIFIAGVMGRQNTSRDGFEFDFLASEEWQNLRRALALQVVPLAEKLVGDELAISKTPLDSRMQSMAERLNTVFGIPSLEGIDEDGPVVHNPPKPPKPTNPPPKPPKPIDPPGGGGSGGGGGPSRPKKRDAIVVCVDDITYVLRKNNLGAHRFASVTASPGKSWRVGNISTEYAAAPGEARACAEHELVCWMDAIACFENPDDPVAAVKRRGELLQMFHGAKKRR